jgi:hypothetical protein
MTGKNKMDTQSMDMFCSEIIGGGQVDSQLSILPENRRRNGFGLTSEPPFDPRCFSHL